MKSKQQLETEYLLEYFDQLEAFDQVPALRGLKSVFDNIRRTLEWMVGRKQISTSQYNLMVKKLNQGVDGINIFLQYHIKREFEINNFRLTGSAGLIDDGFARYLQSHFGIDIETHAAAYQTANDALNKCFELSKKIENTLKKYNDADTKTSTNARTSTAAN